MSDITTRLNDVFSRPRAPYAILRPDIVHDAPGVARWLRHHPDGGWLQSGDEDRMVAARRLLFTAWRLWGRPADADALRASLAAVDAVGAEVRNGY